ncbi:MAG TPA: lysozyme inhibitor LprI family protein, partial [Rhizomicrobium sp.]|nr:lysozyme inhibitor LprI family protein [Rhizomicrobium sp.]
PGASPEAGFAGVWRVIGAQSAPWAKPRKLSRADAPLLEYAVDFVQGAVKGPAPLACPNAKYASGVSYRGDLFAGKLANDTTGALAQAVHLPQGEAGTYRVFCGAAIRDYYSDDAADLVMAEGDVVYTLERPTGMDPEQYKAGFSGPSIDCAKARTTAARLICTDAALAQSDKKLGAVYGALQKSVSPEAFATFQSSERAWLAYVSKVCGANGPMPDSPGDRGTIADCLTGEYGDRAELLDGFKTEQAGALTIEPRMRFRTRANPTTEDSDVYPLMSGGPQAASFNAFVSRTLRLGTWRMDDKSLFRYSDGLEGMRLHARRYYSVARFDGRIVSLQVGSSDFVGGHDEEHYRSALNWDIAASQPLTLGDMFGANTKWKAFAFAYCMKDLRRQTADDGMTEADLGYSGYKDAVSDGAHWLWRRDRATVMFTVLMNSGMPPAEYDVDIPYTLLKPYMKPGAPAL